MLISPPFLTDNVTQDVDAEAVRYSFTGCYPLNSFGEWHNGVHLVAPTLATGGHAPVRAIADGEVIHLVHPKPSNTNKDDAQNYGAFSDNPEWTDNGLIILKHAAEIGHDGTSPVSFVFYSVYMHIKSIGKITVKDAKGKASNRELKLGDKLYRKAELGHAGHIYGQPNHLHFEVSMDETNLSKLLGHAPSAHPLASTPPTAGRTDVVFGSAYVYLPAGIPLLASEPQTHVGTTSTETLGTPLLVQIDYAGSATLTSYLAQDDAKDATRKAGSLLGGNATSAQITEPDGEYKLYEQANKRHKALSEALKAQSSPSGWYELLRFGRKLGPDPLPPGAEHWREIQTPAGKRWANLNARGTVVLSDGDFPGFRGWQCINDDTNTSDQRCDSPALRGLLLREFADKAQREKAQAKTLEGRKLLATKAINPSATVQDRLNKLICKFPCEFDKSNIDARYAHVKEEAHFKDNPKNWDSLKAHITALCTDLPAEFKAADWHVHPVAFINHMRRCGWLDAGTLRRIYSNTPEATVNKYIADLNRVTRKYGFNTPKRLPHFIGQGGVESAYLNTMIEAAQTIIYKDGKPFGGPIIPDSKKDESAFGHWWGMLPSERVDWYGNRKYNSAGTGSGAPYDWNRNLGNLGAPDGQKFRGRGFKQLTGRDNYSQYWLYRGWINGGSFDANWWDDPEYRSKNESGMRRRPAQINDPERISINAFNCMDTGGWFMTFKATAVIKEMDLASKDVDLLIKAVTQKINGGENGLSDRNILTKKAMEISR